MLVVIQKYRLHILLIIIDIIFFGLFSPNDSSFVIVPALVLLVLTLFVVLTLITDYVANIVTVKPRAKKRFIMTTTACGVIILALQSTGQLTVRDVVALLPLAAVLYLYLSYLQSRQT